MGSFFITHVPPIIYYLLGFIIGIVCSSYSFLLCLFFILILLAFCYYKRVALIISFILFGSLSCQIYTCLYEQAALTVPTNPITITGHIIDIQKTNHRLFKYMTVISLESINERPISWFNPHRKLHVYITSYPSVHIDDHITVKEMPCKQPPVSSYRNHLMREQTIATAFIPKLVPTTLERPSYSYKRFLYTLKKATTKRAAISLNPVTQALYASLFLGNKTYTNASYESIKEHFRRWGLSHYLARSGLHLVLIIALWLYVFRIIPIPFIFKQIIIIFLVLTYAVLSWSSVSFIRALGTFFLSKLCSALWHYPYNNLHLLSITAFYLLIHNPLHLFYLDFQLSFGITFALAWLHLLKTYQAKAETQTIAS